MGIFYEKTKLSYGILGKMFNANKGKSKHMLLKILSFFVIILFLFSSPLYAFFEKEAPSSSVDTNQTLQDDPFAKIRLKEGKCIEPSEMVSPCELRCAPTEEELKMARIAWKYIENNFDKKTGLTAAAHKYPSAATWDWANAVYAIYAALKFHLITQERYEKMMNTFLKTMQKMELFNNELPNKTYNTKSAKMTDYVNKIQKEGTGWSAADLARLLSALNVVEQCEETLAPQIEKLTLRYRYCRALSVEGDLYGGTYKDGKLHILHEALTGYEEYLARGYELWHNNASEARQYKFVKEVDVYGIKIPTDTRPFFSNFVESEPFWYLGFEYGVDDNESGRYIHNIYQVQEERYKHTGQLTAVTEDNIDTRPYFLFNTIYTHGEAWKTINQKGEDYDEFKTVSSKAAIGMRYLFDTPYANKVFNYVKNNYDPKKGFYAGIYEKRPGQNKAMTLNTNAIILESMLSAKMGPLQKLNLSKKRTIYNHYRNTVNNFRCLPTETEMLVLEPYAPQMGDVNRSHDIQDAKIAWRYFENNYYPKTGLVSGLNKYKIIKPEHIGKTIMASIAAYHLHIISADVFHKRMSRLLETLGKMKLYHHELPNLYYDAKTGKRVTKAGKVTQTGNGWNLYSIAQMMTGLYYLEQGYPIYREKVFSIVSKWQFKRALLDKRMQNRYFDGKSKGGFKPVHDPAKEYYIFNALRLFNIKSYSHLYDERNLDYKAVYHYEVPMGYKDKITNAESYLWGMIEHPYYLKYKHYASNIYLALKDRYIQTNKLVTSTEEALDSSPYWIQNTIYNHGKLWSDLNRENKSVAKKNILSTKAAFIYDALYGYTDTYAKALKQRIQKNYNKNMGWYGGIYTHSDKPNKSLNILTNAAVLESLYYKKVGNLYYAKKKKLYDKIALHPVDIPLAYSIQSQPIALRFDAQKLMNSLPDQSQIIRVERKEENFVVNVGAFKDKNKTIAYAKSLEKLMPKAKVIQTSIHSKNFLLANSYYRYDYHIPYANKNIDQTNKPYAIYAKKVKIKRKQLTEKKNSSKKPLNKDASPKEPGKQKHGKKKDTTLKKKE